MNDEKVKFTYLTQLIYGVLDSINMCHFVYGAGWQLYGPTELLNTMKAVTGWNDMTMEEMLEVGERRAGGHGNGVFLRRSECRFLEARQHGRCDDAGIGV